MLSKIWLRLNYMSILLFIAFIKAFPQEGFSQVNLTTQAANLSIDKDGAIKIVRTNDKTVLASGSLYSLWDLSIQNKKESTILSQKIEYFQPTKNTVVNKIGEEILISTTDFKVGDKLLPVEAAFKIAVLNDAFAFSAQIKCKSDEWLPREFTYPIFDELKIEGDNQVYWPNGLGQFFKNGRDFDKQNFDYPGGTATMQWFSINNEKSGIYIASHDPLRGKKKFSLAYSKEKNSFKSSVQFPIYGKDFNSPSVLVAAFNGTWHEAAKRYRRWYESVFQLPQIPFWVKQDAGWLLAILKQQNGHVMWNYNEIDKLCDLAKERNLTTIGLFGWANGGHDNLFPNFIPDNLMGGKVAIKDAIIKAHKRGIKIVLYANAFIFDVSTEYYHYNGNEVAAMTESQSPYLQSVRKYFDATPVVFAMASPSSSLWRKTMFDLAIQANELGADGILYDQMGVSGPVLDFSKFHDSTLPQEGFTKYRFQMLSEIRTKMKQLNPDFIIMTEATNDAVLTDIDYHHGWGIGTALEPIGFNSKLHSFPPLFRYTFPELVETQRNANPMVTRSEANFAAIHGLRHEIETRYDEDVAYLLRGVMPDSNSYSNVAYYPPVPQKINESSKEDATKYMHDLIQFENENGKFFRTGKYIDEEGFAVAGKDITAKGFLNGKELGIVVWNQNKNEPNGYKIAVPGYQFVEAREPETDNKDKALKPNSLRLLIYSKK